MEPFLLPLSILFLVLNIASALTVIRLKPTAYWRLVDEQGISHVYYQFICALMGGYLLHALSVAAAERVLAVPVVLLVLDTLTLMLFFRRLPTEGALARYYRSGVGMYVSVMLHMVYYSAAVWLLRS